MIADTNPSNLPASTPTGVKWTLTQEAFESFLKALDTNRDLAGEKYNEIRNNLVRFFQWRACPFPDDHTDETINRVARKVAEGEILRNASAYCLGVARLVVLEIFKAKSKEQQALDEIAYIEGPESQEPESEDRIGCLRHCLQQLTPENRDLIVQYYEGMGAKKIANRKSLTKKLGIPVNTLRMRAVRLREKLQCCVVDCLKN